jgi:hypothetical protein
LLSERAAGGERKGGDGEDLLGFHDDSRLDMSE